MLEKMEFYQKQLMNSLSWNLIPVFYKQIKINGLKKKACLFASKYFGIEKLILV